MAASRKPRLILFLLIVLCGYFVYGYTARLLELSQLQAQIEAKEAQIDLALADQAELQAELQRRTSVDYLDEVARELFNYARPGDTVLVVVKPETDAAPDAVAMAAPADANDMTATAAPAQPVWQQWVTFFTTTESANP